MKNPLNIDNMTLSETDRVYRVGQQKKVTVIIDLVTHGTVDTKILKALRNKINFGDRDRR